MATRGKRTAANGDGSVYYDRGRGRWYAAITHEDGARQKWACEGRDAARARLAQAILERARRLPPTSDRASVEQYLAWWLRHSLRCRPTTLVTYERIVALHLVPSLGRLQLRNLTPEHVEALMSRSRRDGVSLARINVIRATLRQALAAAERRGLVHRNAAALVEPYRVRPRQPLPLAADECRQLLDAARDDRLHTLYLCAIALGLRQGELLGLSWADVDLAAGQIRVRQQLQRIRLGEGARLRPALVELKTARSARPLRAPQVVVAALAERRRSQIEERLLSGPRWVETGLVFTTRHGSPLDAGNLRRAFHLALTRAGLAPRRFHDLRHSYASLLEEAGVHPFVAQELLGHTRVEMTKRYSHPYDAAKADAAERVGGLLEG